LGIAFEFYDGSFHERTWDELGGQMMKRRDFWAKQHPLGLTGLVGWSIAVSDIDAASAFMEGFLSARVIYETERKAIGARVIGLAVADEVVELLAPNGEGALARHHYRFGDGIRATRFGARDLGKVRDWFTAKGITLGPGDIDGSLALPEQANLGLIFEFVEVAD
jgi:catechol 2,3-dioxygenase-like lactoylglutathione lyase family enzyme